MVKEPKRGVTLQTLAAVSAVLYRWRIAFGLLGAAAAVWFGAVILNPAAAGQSGLMPLSLLMWSALGLGMAYTLPRRPEPVAPDDGFGQRLRKRCLQAGYVLAAIVLFALAAFSLWLTWRAIGV